MIVTLLGTGTSTGVPVIGCRCAVCRSANPRNRRLRVSAHLEGDGQSVLIDTSVDLRRQALDNGIHRLDAILYTHSHADHILGLDEIRIFNFRQGSALPAYGSPETLENLRRSFWYVFEHVYEGGGKPHVELRPVDGPFRLGPWEVVPVPVEHGPWKIHGFRIGAFAYVTDASRIPESSMPLLEGLDVLVLNALRESPHPTHFTLSQSLEAIGRLRPKTAYLTHMGHEMDHDRVEAMTPPDVHPAWDGLRIEI